MKKWMLFLCGMLVVILLALYIAFQLSPKPGTALIRYALNREVPVQNGSNYVKASENIVRLKDETYRSRYARNTFDVYYPNDLRANEKIPTIIWLHGGSYVAGDKSYPKEFAHYIVESERVAFVSMNYEFAPELKYPGQLHQLEELIVHLQKRNYPFIDLTKLVIGGDSAGAQIAGQFVLTQTNASYAKEIERLPVLPKASIKGFISYSGPVDIQQMAHVKRTDVLMHFFAETIGWNLTGTKNWRESPILQHASIAKHVTRDFPPTFITDGELFSFPAQGKALVKSLKQHDVSVTDLFFDGENLLHEYQFQYDTNEAAICLEETKKYLQQLFK